MNALRNKGITETERKATASLLISERNLCSPAVPASCLYIALQMLLRQSSRPPPSANERELLSTLKP